MSESSSTDEAQKIWLDGEIIDKADAKISVFDHGVLYGDGIFEGIRMYSGRVFRLEEHISRLFDSAKRRPTPASLSPQVKSLNYLNNVMAKIECIQAGVMEGIMLNEQGYVAECTGDNVFIVKKGILYTPPVSDGSLDGITREVIFDLCDSAGLEIREKSMTRHDIFTCDEAFLTGTAAEVIPFIKLDQRQIGNGTPGPISKQLIHAFRTLANTEGTISCC